MSKNLPWYCFLLSALIPATATAQPFWVTVEADPFMGINTLLTISAGFAGESGDLKVKIIQVPSNLDEPEVVRTFFTRDEVSRGVSGDAKPEYLPDLNTDGYIIQVQALLFLPLGTYKVEISSLSGSITSEIAADTRVFPLRIVRAELTRRRDRGLPPWLGIPREGSTHLSSGRILAEVTPLSPPKTVSADDLIFRWHCTAPKGTEAILYVLDPTGLIWQQPTRKTEVVYGGPALKADVAYFWVVGIKTTDEVFIFREIPSFRLR